MTDIKNQKQRVIFRFDANSEIGLGHLTRSLALASILRDNFKVIVAIQNPVESIISSCLEVTEDIIILPASQDYAQDASVFSRYLNDRDIVVLDGYGFDTDYQKSIKKLDCRLVCIDDIYSIHFVADAIINHNPVVKASDYSAEAGTHLYLGFDYLLLRKEFMECAKEPRTIGLVNTAFICMGGSDPMNLTHKCIVAAIGAGLFQKISVVCGSANKYFENLKADFSNVACSVDFYSSIGPSNMVNLLEESQVAICPSSSISFEVFCVGLNLVTGYYAENQRMIADYIKSENLGLVVGDLNTISEEVLEKAVAEVSVSAYYKRQKEIMHGNNIQQIRAIFESLSTREEIKDKL